MNQLRYFIHEKLLQLPQLAGCQNRLAIALAGSRSVGYHTSSSDYDLLGFCDASTYARLLRNTGYEPSVAGIDISVDRKEAEQMLGREVDFAVYEADRIKDAFQEFNDVVLWIWTNAQAIVDPYHAVSELQASFDSYPRDVLEQKLKQHFLQDFHLSVHGLTYHPESQNIFAVLNTMTSKIGEYCKMCCLLDGKPFPYEKWLLRACADTQLGTHLVPIFERVLTTLSCLQNDLPGQWPGVREAINAMDTDACDVLEDALVSWGINKTWLDRSYHDRHIVLFKSL
jgi:hypothetical protein